jgi:hypothetical protein
MMDFNKYYVTSDGVAVIDQGGAYTVKADDNYRAMDKAETFTDIAKAANTVVANVQQPAVTPNPTNQPTPTPQLPPKPIIINIDKLLIFIAVVAVFIALILNR